MLNHWNCLICKSYNDILSNHCHFCKANKPESVTSEYQARIEIKRGIFLARIASSEHIALLERQLNKL